MEDKKIQDKTKTKPCAFFSGPKGCNFGEKCKFLHAKKDVASKPLRKEEEQPHPEPIYDAESGQKIKYLESMLESLKESCRKCKKEEHLVLASCGCQTLCRSCAQCANKCPLGHPYAGFIDAD